MSTDRNPDRGDVAEIRSAGWAIEDIAAALNQRKADAASATGRVNNQVWSGQSATAFADTAADIDQMAQSTVEGWARLATALTDYQNSLQSLQDEGDAIRTRLASAEAERNGYQTHVIQASVAALSSEDATAAGQISVLNPLLQDASRLVEQELKNLDDLATRRRQLDAQAVDAIAAAPGPGAQAWSGLAYYSDGTPKSTDSVVDEMVDLINSTQTLTAEDYQLISQFMAAYSADSDAMARLRRTWREESHPAPGGDVHRGSELPPGGGTQPAAARRVRVGHGILDLG